MNEIYHQLIQLSTFSSYKKFYNSTSQLEAIQRGKLKIDYDKFVAENPITQYSNYQNNFEEILSNNKIKCVPTSGSTSAIKWIPYTKEFKSELWNASAPWLYDLYTRYPEIKSGKHFWSMSWLPNDLRAKIKTDDLEIFGSFEKLLLKKTMALNESSLLVPTLHEAMLNSTLSLLNNPISLISVWSPTFLLELLNLLFTEKDFFLDKMNKQKKEILKNHQKLTADFCREMFPDLKLISAWESAQSSAFALELKKIFPHVKFQGKGLWATEGVVSIPFQNHFVLSYQSHFYEFRIKDTDLIIPSWKLEKGMQVEVILSTGSGIKRYETFDIVLIDDFFNGIPTLKFLGRNKEVDLVGEKLNMQFFSNIIEELKVEHNQKIAFFVAKKLPHPHYSLVLSPNNSNVESLIQIDIENKLMKNFHYRLAREANQLSDLKIEIASDIMQTYLNYASQKIEIKGNIKLEPIIIV